MLEQCWGTISQGLTFLGPVTQTASCFRHPAEELEVGLIGISHVVVDGDPWERHQRKLLAWLQCQLWQKCVSSVNRVSSVTTVVGCLNHYPISSVWIVC